MEQSSVTSRAEQGCARGYLRYLAWVFALPLLGYLLVFPLVMFPQLGFDRWGGSKWAPVLDYSYRAAPVNADVVVFGDSSAFLGVDPRLIDSQLGTRTVVLPNTVGSLQVTGDMALRRYLANNRPPKAIVFYFTPWDLDFRHSSPPQFVFEGEEVLLRNGSLREIAAYAVHHPRAMLMFPFQMNALVDAHGLKLALTTDRRAQTVAARGHMDYTDPIGPIGSRCTLPAADLHGQNLSPISALMQRYARPGTRVFLYLSPIPGCENAGKLNIPPVQGVQTLSARTLPPEWFAADGLYAHVLPPHVRVETALLADALRAWNVAQPAAANAVHMAARAPL